MSARDPLPQIENSIQRRMVLILSGIIVGLVLLLGLPLVVISVNLQRQAAISEHQAITNRTAQNLSDIIRNLETGQLPMSTADSNNPAVASLANQLITLLNLTTSRVSAQIQDAIDQQESLEQLFSLNPQILGIKRFTPDGLTTQESYWQAEPLAANNIRPNASSQALVAQGITTQDAFIFDRNYTPILVVATPLIEQDQVTGLALAWIEIPTIWSTLVDTRIGRNGYLYIVDQEGKPMAVPDRFIGQSTSTIGLTDAGHTRAHPGLNGELVMSKIAPVENTPWYVVTEIPLREANANLRSLLIIVTAIVFFSLALASLMARLFSRWLLSPIETLHHSATRISEGDLSHRIELDRDDELGFLAGAFNRMVATLEQTINQLHTVSQNLISAQEAERHRIAQEIHDELGQMLTALKLNLWLSIKADPDNPNLLAAQEQATAVQEKARTLSHELRPAMLDDLGLLATLEWYTDRFEQRANLAIVLDTTIDESKLSGSLKTTLYRLIAEALTNISKHAQASVVEICLAQTAETLQLTVNDDGVGFETTILSQTQALGVASMRERVNLLQGEFLIESEVGRGTRITILLPLGLPDPPEPQAESLLGEPESRQTPSQTEVAPS